jgi:hypothetical protein
MNPLNPQSREEALAWIAQALQDYCNTLPPSARTLVAMAANVCVTTLRDEPQQKPVPSQVL